jgi:hypothetical protein
MSRLRLYIAGESGRVSFRTFVDTLNRTRLILAELDQAISEQDKPQLEWAVTGLAVGSAEAVIETEETPITVDPRLGTMVSENFVNGLGVVQEGDAIPPYYSDTALRRIGTIAQRLGKNGAESFQATHLDGGSSATVDAGAHAHVQQALAPRSHALGSVLGRLGLVSVEPRAYFNVYDALTHRAVRCRFKDEQFEEVRAALRQRVIVSGTVHRNARGTAISVDNAELTVMPNDAELPGTADIAGLDRGFTGELPVGEYVRELR